MREGRKENSTPDNEKNEIEENYLNWKQIKVKTRTIPYCPLDGFSLKKLLIIHYDFNKRIFPCYEAKETGK